TKSHKKLKFQLITQRSKVQILASQPQNLRQIISVVFSVVNFVDVVGGEDLNRKISPISAFISQRKKNG
ncbi:MAG TPA: hypothetical protein VEA58_12820, partial [Anaerovoracaceae bacterium]|nr:hypothetical protein [Anaerovoracaceae bacterium]